MRFTITLFVGVVCCAATFARPEFRGPLPDEQKEIIHYLAEHHAALKREVKLTDHGYTAITTSENPDIVKKLLTHFDYMEKRLDSGAMVRRWDPAFEEMVEYYEQLETNVKKLENGIQVIVKGTTPEAVKVAQNHARIVSGFVNEGQTAVSREHTKVVED